MFVFVRVVSSVVAQSGGGCDERGASGERDGSKRGGKNFFAFRVHPPNPSSISTTSSLPLSRATSRAVRPSLFLAAKGQLPVESCFFSIYLKFFLGRGEKNKVGFFPLFLFRLSLSL